MSEQPHCTGKCPVDDRERDLIWQRIDELKAVVTVLDKNQAVQHAEINRLIGLIESTHTAEIDRLDKLETRLEDMMSKLANDSATLLRREGEKTANMRWLKYITLAIALLTAAGGYLAFEPAVAITQKDPSLPKHVHAQVESVLN
jgi:hypothetical protein